MNKKHIASYLNDHLAGSTLGIELASTLAKHGKDANATAILFQLEKEFQDERSQLKQLMHKLTIEESNLRKAGAWLNAKLLEAKLHLEDHGPGEFFMFEGLEALSTGIAGKHLLWVVLHKLSEGAEPLKGYDFPLLIQQALSQRERVEGIRIEFAQQTLL